MISLKDYTILYSDYFKSPRHNQNHLKQQLQFFYLYPSENSLNKKHFVNEKQQLLVVTQLNDFQQCQTLIQLIQSSQEQIFSPSHEFCVLEHKNHNAQKRFLVISSNLQQNTLQKIAQNHFFENINVPSEQFCTYLIERLLEIYRRLLEKGLCLKVISPQHIVIYQRQIFLNFPFPHNVFDWNPNTFLLQFQQCKPFCAPQILKMFNISKYINQSQNENTTNVVGNSDSISYPGNSYNKQFKKAILYSLGLIILYCFGFHVPFQDRLMQLKNPNKVNNFLDQLRKQIKLHHDGKFISKLLKLMLEHSESLRDTISTFTYKMKSVQFSLLRKEVQKNTNSLSNQQNIQTQSQVNSQPFLNTNLSKKTIDIRISSMSNTSSMINRSWLSVSQQNFQGKITSPSQFNKSLQGERQKDRTVKNGTLSNQLNEIEEIKEPSSPIEFDIEWDQDSSIRGSNKSSKQKSKSSSDKDKKDKTLQLLNKISEKQEGQQQIDFKCSKQKCERENQDQENSIPQWHSSPKKIMAFKNQIINEGQINHISKSQIGTKTQNKNIEFNKSVFFQSDKRISGTQSKKIDSKHNNDESQNNRIPSFQTIEPKILQNTYESTRFKQFQYQLQQRKQINGPHDMIQEVQIKVFRPLPLKILPQNRKQFQSQSASVNEQSTMCILKKEENISLVCKSQLNHSMTLQVEPDLIDQQNQSIMLEQPFFDDQELKMQQKLIKQNKVREKQKLTERKKDQYNERSKAILLTLIFIFGVFKLIDFLLGKDQAQTGK